MLRMTSRSYFGKMNSTLGSVVPLAMFEINMTDQVNPFRFAVVLRVEEQKMENKTHLRGLQGEPTQQCTPLLPLYTQRRCSKPKSSRNPASNIFTATTMYLQYKSRRHKVGVGNNSTSSTWHRFWRHCSSCGRRRSRSSQCRKLVLAPMTEI